MNKILILMIVIIFIKDSLNEEIKAFCKLIQSQNSGVSGVINFSQKSNLDNVKINGEIENLLAIHAFHIHEFPMKGNNCTSAGFHFNPTNSTHGGPGKESLFKHLGDLGNIKSKGRKTSFSMTSEDISLTGENSILNKTCIIHEGEDDLGLGELNSKIDGNSGNRISCGIIYRSSSIFFNPLTILNLILLISLII